MSETCSYCTKMRNDLQKKDVRIDGLKQNLKACKLMYQEGMTQILALEDKLARCEEIAGESLLLEVLQNDS